MRRVVVNSTPLIALSNIGQLELLHKLYGQIMIPQAVYDEVTAKHDSACNQIRSFLDWIQVKPIRNIDEKKMYRAKLHTGEVEVMILAQENPIADLVIIDDNAAKKTAKYLGLPVTGTLGVLLKAKRCGLVDSIQPLLKKLQQIGFHIGDDVLRYVLEEAGEVGRNIDK